MAKDSWTTEEDELLAETVIQHIKNGSTQIKAFEEAGKKLTRTAAACGFRWNSVVRKKYQKEVEEAKQERKSKKREQKKEQVISQQQAPTNPIIGQLNLSMVIEYLRLLETSELDTEKLKRELEQERREKEEIKEKFHSLQKEHEQLKSEFQSLQRMLEQVREVVVVKQEEVVSNNDV
jgi:prespore-specific regulator